MSKIIFAIVSFCLLASCQTKPAVEDNANTVSAVSSGVSQENVKANKPAEPAPAYSPTPSAIKNDEINSRIGNIQSSEQSVCLKIQNPDLKAGDKVQIIFTDKPQEVFDAEISELSDCRQSGFGTLDRNNITNYILTSSNKDLLDRGYGIGIVNPPQKVRVSNGVASLDIDGDKKDEYFRDCASMEGMHLTVWTGKPLTGKRIWHSYYGVGYDTVSNCKKADYEGTDE